MTSFEEQFKSNADCISFLVDARWPGGSFCCPACAHNQGTRLRKRGLIECKDCGKQTSVTSGTLFHGARIPLLKLFKILWDLCAGIGQSALQVANDLEIAYDTAWRWLHRFRTVIEREMSDNHGLIQVHWSKLIQVLFRRSDETAGKHQQEDSTNNERIYTNEANPNRVDKDQLETSVQNTSSFIACIFHGISKKYLQKYKAVVEEFQERQGEDRWLAYALLENDIVVIVYEQRGKAKRIISLRKANKKERVHFETESAREHGKEDDTTKWLPNMPDVLSENDTDKN